MTNFEYETMNVNGDQVNLLFDCKNSGNHIKSSANLFLAGFSHLELTVSRPGDKAVLAQDGWQYSLGRIKLPVLSTGLLATLPEKNSGNSSI